MSPRILLPILFLATWAPLGAACSDDGDDPVDTGVSVDAHVNDSGLPRDTGVTPTDAGFDDQGLPIDAGFPDSGVVPDTGVDTDSGMTADAGPGPNCNPNFAAADACGGDVTGVWNYGGACTNFQPFSQLMSICPGTVVGTQANTSQGTVTFTGGAASGSFVRSVDAIASINVSVPLNCVPSCLALAANLMGAAGVVADCQTTASACDCRVERHYEINDQGDYTVNGGTLTALPAGGGSYDYDFCVAGGTLTYKGQSTNATDKDFVYILTP